MQQPRSEMVDLHPSPTVILVMVAVVVACLALLIHMGNPEPALPRCPANGQTIVRCEP